jgi:uncharacterized oxidoreductase
MDRRVLITGTTSGIGRGLLEHYAKAGWAVTAFNRRSDPETAARFPNARFVLADVRDRAKVEDYFREAAAKGELPELYFLNAGINRGDTYDRFDLGTFQDVMDINLTGVLNFVAAAMPHLSDRKAVFVTSSSTSNIFPNPCNLGYFVSKKASAEMFALLDRRYRARGWRFKTMILGPIATNIAVGSTLSSRLQSAVRDFLMMKVEQAVPDIERFVASDATTLYYPKKALAVFLAAAAATKVLPGLYQGSRRAGAD